MCSPVLAATSRRNAGDDYPAYLQLCSRQPCYWSTGSYIDYDNAILHNQDGYGWDCSFVQLQEPEL